MIMRLVESAAVMHPSAMIIRRWEPHARRCMLRISIYKVHQESVWSGSVSTSTFHPVSEVAGSSSPSFPLSLPSLPLPSSAPFPSTPTILVTIHFSWRWLEFGMVKGMRSVQIVLGVILQNNCSWRRLPLHLTKISGLRAQFLHSGTERSGLGLDLVSRADGQAVQTVICWFSPMKTLRNETVRSLGKTIYKS